MSNVQDLSVRMSITIPDDDNDDDDDDGDDDGIGSLLVEINVNDGPLL
jgi:hypothetical protein